jgi:hypothetical protein
VIRLDLGKIIEKFRDKACAVPATICFLLSICVNARHASPFPVMYEILTYILRRDNEQDNVPCFLIPFEPKMKDDVAPLVCV